MALLNQREDTKPWYKQFWPWVILILPLSAVIAGLTTVYIAYDGADTPVKKDYYLAGIQINQRTKLIENAARLGIQGHLHYDQSLQLFQIKLDGPQQNVDSLNVALRHPAYEPLDRTITLTPSSEQTYQTRFELPMTGKWYITLTDNDKTWLLEDQILLDESTTLTLRPSRQ